MLRVRTVRKVDALKRCVFDELVAHTGMIIVLRGTLREDQ